MNTRTADTGFWFRTISAGGFGLMRIAFGAVAFVTFLLEAPALQRFYGPGGILPHSLLGQIVRQSYRFSLLDFATPGFVTTLFIILLISLFLVTIGLWTKKSLLASVILLFSFHEYGQITLDGGDTLMRLLGFILLLAPCDRSLSLDSLLRRIKLTAETGKDQPSSERTMPIWPYRLLLWQMIMLYVAASIEKLSGAMWWSGSAIAAVLHHGDFSRLSPAAADALSVFSPAIGYFTVSSQLAWSLLLPLGALSAIGLISPKTFNVGKRFLLICGLMIHGGIFVLMDVGTFSITVFTAYLGLLTDDDFRWIRKILTRKKKQTTVLFDGRCGFCAKTILILKSFDWLHRLHFANYHDIDVRKKYAPEIPLQTLDEEMHVVLENGITPKGFYAFRALAWQLPPLLPIAPLLYVPGLSLFGELVYQYIANHRDH